MELKNRMCCWIFLTIAYAPFIYSKCELPTIYKSYYSYTVFLTKPDKAADDFFLVLTKNKHSLYTGQSHRRMCDEPIIRFKRYNPIQHASNSSQALVHYHDFMDAINSDQPAHNVRVRSDDHYITLSKIFVREFRNGLAGRTLNRLVHAITP